MLTDRVEAEGPGWKEEPEERESSAEVRRRSLDRKGGRLTQSKSAEGFLRIKAEEPRQQNGKDGSQISGTLGRSYQERMLLEGHMLDSFEWKM